MTSGFLPKQGGIEELGLNRVQILLSAGEFHDSLTQLRDWLLPMLMNGQVTVA
jgi:hypothetical protein